MSTTLDLGVWFFIGFIVSCVAIMIVMLFAEVEHENNLKHMDEHKSK